MNPERWQQIKHALDSVLALQSAQRPPYLEKLSTIDPELHREVESLLRSHEQADSSFLRDPAVAVLPGFEAPRTARTGRRIGAYDILEEIGHGGMGEVYRAVRADGEFDREVAVKVVRSGFDSQFILERFRHERQILGWSRSSQHRALARRRHHRRRHSLSRDGAWSRERPSMPTVKSIRSPLPADLNCFCPSVRLFTTRTSIW